MSENQTLMSLSAKDVAKRTKQAENIQTLYSNHARVAMGYFDIRVFIGEANVTATGEFTFNEQLCVAMTPEFAKRFSDLLSAQLVEYEERFGKIRPMPLQVETTGEPKR